MRTTITDDSVAHSFPRALHFVRELVGAPWCSWRPWALLRFRGWVSNGFVSRLDGNLVFFVFFCFFIARVGWVWPKYSATEVRAVFENTRFPLFYSVAQNYVDRGVAEYLGNYIDRRSTKIVGNLQTNIENRPNTDPWLQTTLKGPTTFMLWVNFPQHLCYGSTCHNIYVMGLLLSRPLLFLTDFHLFFFFVFFEYFL